MMPYVGSVQYVISLLFVSVCYFLITRLMFFFIYSFHVRFLFCMFVFYFVYSMFLNCFMFVSLVVHSCLFPIFVQVYEPLPPGENYRIIFRLPVFVSVDAYICHVSYVFVLVLSRIGNIWVWSLGGIPRSLPFLIQENSSRPKPLTPSNTY